MTLGFGVEGEGRERKECSRQLCVCRMHVYLSSVFFSKNLFHLSLTPPAEERFPLLPGNPSSTQAAHPCGVGRPRDRATSRLLEQGFLLWLRCLRAWHLPLGLHLLDK